MSDGIIVFPSAPAGIVQWPIDATLNNSDKSVTLASMRMAKLGYIHGEITATATVGNRLLWIVITNGTSTVWTSPKTTAITAAQVGVIEAYPGAAYTTTAAQVPTLAGATPNVALRVPLPPDLLLKGGYVIRIYDSAAIDAAADDLTTVLHYVEYSVVQ